MTQALVPFRHISSLPEAECAVLPPDSGFLAQLIGDALATTSVLPGATLYGHEKKGIASSDTLGLNIRA